MTTGRINQVTNKSTHWYRIYQYTKERRMHSNEWMQASVLSMKQHKQVEICSVSQRVIEVRGLESHTHHIAKCSGFHQCTKSYRNMIRTLAVPYSFSSFELFLEAARRRKTHSTCMLVMTQNTHRRTACPSNTL